MLEYRYKRAPWKHQKQALRLSARRPAFALFMEMRTGKTKVVIDNAGMLRDEIDRVLVLCPNGVQRNWIEDIELNFPYDCYAAFWAGRLRDGKTLKPIKEMPGGRSFRFLIMNVEALLVKEAYKMAERFMQEGRAMLAVDESTRIKGHTTGRTKKVMRLGALSKYRRILSGAPSPNGPVDLYSQFMFLDPDILGLDSITAFKASYCVLMENDHPLVRHIAKKMPFIKNQKDPEKKKKLVQEWAGRIQIPERGSDGMPLYKNLDILEQKIAPHIFRVLKKDCLDIPPKVYQKRFVELSPKQRQIYDQIRDEIIAEFVHLKELRTVTSEIAIKRMTRLAQVICNHYVPDPDYDEAKKPQPQRIEKKGDNPRIEALREIIEDADRPPLIVWTRHRYDFLEIAELFDDMKISYGNLWGGLGVMKREQTRVDFQAGKIGAIIGIAALGIGINLSRADLNVYYSNSFDLEHRLQSEERSDSADRKGALLVVDLIAENTNDEKVVATLRAKKNIEHAILRDKIEDWI
jgi:SNF2 family DNA or RNA helicase